MISGIYALILAVLLIVYEDAEVGDGSSAKFQFGIVVTIFASLPIGRKARRLLSAKNKMQIEEYYQIILAIFLSSMLSVCFVIFQAIGCLSRDDELKFVRLIVCRVLPLVFQLFSYSSMKCSSTLSM